MKNLKLATLTAIFMVIVLITNSCTDAGRAKLGGFGDEFKVEMLNCDGEVVRTWLSSGKVLSEANSDGYYFRDKETGKLIEVTGTLIITKQ
jgi:hypothetical protein